MRTITMEQIISYAVLVPVGNGDPSSGPGDPGCLMGLNICWWGAPGIGKSARVNAGGAAAGLATRVVLPSHRAPEDFGGVPVLGQNGELRLECILGAVRELLLLPPHEEHGPRGLLFIDEVTWARPATQGALLGAVQDRRIGDTVLPPGIRIMLAANPPEVAGGGWELNPPLANRMAHIALPPPTAEEWVSWLLGRSGRDVIDVTYGEGLVRALWSDAFARAKGVMAGFMRSVGGQHLHTLPPEGDPNRGRAWPSPRGWDLATRVLATCLALDTSTDREEVLVKKEEKNKEGVLEEQKTLALTGSNQMAHLLIEAIVGEDAALAWITWLAEADLPDPEDALQHGWKIDHQRLDRTVAVLESMTAFVLSRPTQEEKERRAAQLWPFIGQLAKEGFGDMAYNAAADLSLCSPKLDSTNPALTHVAAQPTLALGRGIARSV